MFHRYIVRQLKIGGLLKIIKQAAWLRNASIKGGEQSILTGGEELMDESH